MAFDHLRDIGFHRLSYEIGGILTKKGIGSKTTESGHRVLPRRIALILGVLFALSG